MTILSPQNRMGLIRERALAHRESHEAEARRLAREAVAEDEAEVRARARPKAPARPRGAVSSFLAVVRAVLGLPQPVAFADLVLAAWRASPGQFGLAGHEQQHPDTNRVSAALYSRTSGALGRGWLRLAGPKRFEVTEAGRLAAANNGGGDGEP